VSRIWDALREAQKHRTEHAGLKGALTGFELVPDRRCTVRLWVYIPVLVYGHTVENGPFHEGTEALCANAGGGLITLTSSVRRGQKLLLMNKVNRKEEGCHVVYQTPKYLGRAAVVIGFPQPIPNFWDKWH
jgi:hypothetical protein